ncbi:nucleotidyltransferase family protein [Peptoniphilus genitalis]
MMEKAKKYEVNAIILASGFSKRFDGNKLKEEINGKKIYSYVIDLIECISFKDKIVVTNDYEIIEYAKSKGIKFSKNPNASEGKSQSIKIGIKNTVSDSEGYMFFMADQPFLKRESIIKLLDKFENNSETIIYPKFAGRKGSPVIIPKSYKELLLELEGDEGGSKYITEKNSLGIEIESESEGIDIDRMEDYNKMSDYFDGNKDW